jgi:F420H(2)-dependent quinone reductase
MSVYFPRQQFFRGSLSDCVVCHALLVSQQGVVTKVRRCAGVSGLSAFCQAVAPRASQAWMAGRCSSLMLTIRRRWSPASSAKPICPQRLSAPVPMLSRGSRRARPAADHRGVPCERRPRRRHVPAHVPVLITTEGRKSGQPRTTPVAYLRDGSRYIIFASNAGRPAHPGWYHNLLTSPQVTHHETLRAEIEGAGDVPPTTLTGVEH